MTANYQSTFTGVQVDEAIAKTLATGAQELVTKDFLAQAMLNCLCNAEDAGSGLSLISAAQDGILTLKTVAAGLNMDIQDIDGTLTFISSAAGSPNYIFWPNAPEQAGNVYKSWTDLMTAISGTPEGTIPTVTFLESYNITSTGMPSGGWDMKGGAFDGIVLATGSITVTVSDGVIIRNLNGVNTGLLLQLNPASNYGMLRWDQFGDFQLLTVGLGAALINGGSAAFMVPNANDFVVLAMFGASNFAVPQPGNAWVESNSTASVVAVEFLNGPFGGLPDNWLVGDAQLFIRQVGIDASTFDLPSYTGPAPLIFNAAKSENLLYDDDKASPQLGASNVQDAIDAIKALLP
jgi:hypothetical protein